MEYSVVGVYARNSKIAAYQSVVAHGGVANEDPHRLVLMLFDGALERLAMARGCLERKGRGDIGKKAQLLTQCLHIIGELRGGLNLTDGGALAQNLSDLYEYMLRQLLRANAENDLERIREVSALLSEIRGAWAAIGPELRKAAPAAPAARGG
jgi:flagellar secretion chaperone FliS